MIDLKEEAPQNKISAFSPTTASAAMNSEVEEPPQKKGKTTFSSLPEEIVVELEEEAPQNQISSFAPSTASGSAMNSDVEPPRKKKTTTFSSLPEEIVVSCLARISKSYYPQLSLVSKSFCSIISSKKLRLARKHLERREKVLYVCLKIPDRLPSWFSLWIKPDQTLTNDKNKSPTRNTLLAPVPSSYTRWEPSTFIGKVSSEKYKILGQYRSSTTTLPNHLEMKVRNDGVNNAWRKAPSMRVAREKTLAVGGVLDEKIYVMGGCKAKETANWAEVFDTKTQTWEALPDPGAELRSSLLKSMRMIEGKVYVESSVEDDCYVYDPKEGRWDVVAKALVDDERTKCYIDVWYSCTTQGCFWYDEKRKKWRVIKGLEEFDRNVRGGGVIALAKYCGKFLIIWDKFEKPGGECPNKNIWCSVVQFERSNDDDEVRGTVEWSSVVLTVPSSYDFLRYEVHLG
ncbi:unnamed protein product [Microthlaspi erraticum]|uniref:F-box domain-containing protein n=1 Tax=Microthlaspi erraticum TaxID=1685480 RepID=A0A6D2K0B7_9BRAS|nr:unnamed protein product [Microthlaspi erraticum]